METAEYSNLYYDPFAENGLELFDPAEVFRIVSENYKQDKIKHDTAADAFVAKTEALVLDAVFLERFDTVQAIVSQLHQMCGEDHMLRNQIASNPFFNTHSKADGHGHENIDLQSDEEDDDYEWVGGKLIKKRKYRK